MNIHELRDMQNSKQINHNYPPLKLLHAEVNMNNNVYSWLFMHLEQCNLMGNNYTSKQI